jgi:Tfp pilus assembly protein PilF
MGTRLRLNLSLVETGEGRVIWSDRIQRPFDEVFEVIDDVAGRVAGTVTGRIDEAEIAAATLKRPDSLTAYERHLRGLSHHRLGGVSDAHFREAKGWFERAMRDDPDFARARAMRVCSWSNLPDYDWDEGRREARAALELDPGDAEANRIVGSIALKDRDYDAARPLHARAVALAPSDAFTVGRCAAFHTFVGETEAAHELLDRAEALDPFLPVFVADERIAALYVEGRHEKVCAAARALPFQTRRSLLYRAAARMARGEPELARRNIARALSLDPTLSLAHVRFVETHSDDARMESLTERLAAAGLPERPPEAAA